MVKIDFKRAFSQQYRLQTLVGFLLCAIALAGLYFVPADKFEVKVALAGLLAFGANTVRSVVQIGNGASPGDSPSA